MDKNSRDIFASLLIATSITVLVLVFGTPGGASQPLLPSAVPLFNWKFGLFFGAVQLLFCWKLGDKKSFWILILVWAVAIPFIHLGSVFRGPMALSGVNRMMAGASCASGLALGIATLKGKIG